MLCQRTCERVEVMLLSSSISRKFAKILLCLKMIANMAEIFNDILRVKMCFTQFNTNIYLNRSLAASDLHIFKGPSTKGVQQKHHRFSEHLPHQHSLLRQCPNLGKHSPLPRTFNISLKRLHILQKKNKTNVSC